MLVLLGMSTLAAALAPPPPRSGEASSTTSTTRQPRESATGGKLVEATIGSADRRPVVVDVPLGDQLSLTVKSRRAGQVVIQGQGLIEYVAPLSPARFDLFADRRGSFQVRMIDPRRKLGTLRFGASNGERHEPGHG